MTSYQAMIVPHVHRSSDLQAKWYVCAGSVACVRVRHRALLSCMPVAHMRMIPMVQLDAAPVQLCLHLHAGDQASLHSS